MYHRLIVAILLLSMGVSSYSCKQKSNKEVQAKKPNLPLVKVQLTSRSRMTSSIDITGTIQANVFTEVKSPVDGIIDELFVRENQRSQQGRIIAIVNPSERLTIIANNQLQIEQLQQKIKISENNALKHAELLEELDKARKNLDYATAMFQVVPIICPMNGIVTQRWLDKGSQVSAKEKILTITDMSSLVLKAEVNEKYFGAIKQGKKLPLVLNAYPEDTIMGTISLVYPQVDPETRSVKFDLKLASFKNELLPGMMASIKIPVSIKENALSVVEQAVLTSANNKAFLFVVDKDSIAYRREVSTGIVSGDRIEIVNGLLADDIVVVAGQEMLKDSMRVRIMKSEKIKTQ